MRGEKYGEKPLKEIAGKQSRRRQGDEKTHISETMENKNVAGAFLI